MFTNQRGRSSNRKDVRCSFALSEGIISTKKANSIVKNPQAE
jgi:hypothetical protein